MLQPHARLVQLICCNSLRRRFEQNQTDCTYTVLALLPTATENILEALPVEELTKELQKKRAERLARLNPGEASGSDMTSVSPSATDDDRKSLASFPSEGYVHASQMAESEESEGQPRVKRNKTQLWNEVKITCTFYLLFWRSWNCHLTICSHYTVVYSRLHPLLAHHLHPRPTQSPRSSKLPFQRDLSCYSSNRLNHQLGRPR